MITHVAAVVVAVLVTLALMGTFSSKKPAATEAALSNNQKKKKKRKSKAAKQNNNNDSSTASVATEKTAAVKEEEEVAVKENTNNNNDSNTNGNTNNGGGKKAKKKKNKGGNVNGGATTNGSKGVSEQKEDFQPSTPAATTPTTITNISHSNGNNNESAWQTAPPVEEEWNSVGVTKKKKKKTASSSSTAANKATPSASGGSDSVTIDAKKVGIIIGPKGATMMAIQDATGCKLDINAPGKDDGPPKKTAAKAGVIITGGDKQAIAKAKKAILELASKGYATILQTDSNFGEFGTEVHPRMLSEIVGPNGKTIQAIQQTLSVKITIPPTDWKPNNKSTNIYNREIVKPVMVGIAGTKENAKTAKAVIQSLVKYHHHPITHPGMIHEEVNVPQEFFHCVIGPRGSEIKHIRGNYKVDMYMPNEDSVSENVLVVGRKANVDKAISYIQLLMDRDAEKQNQKYTDEYY